LIISGLAEKENGFLSEKAFLSAAAAN